MDANERRLCGPDTNGHLGAARDQHVQNFAKHNVDQNTICSGCEEIIEPDNIRSGGEKKIAPDTMRCGCEETILTTYYGSASSP